MNRSLVCLARLVQLSLGKDDVVPPVCFDDGVNCNARLQVSDNLREGLPVLCVQVNADKLPDAVFAEMVRSYDVRPRARRSANRRFRMHGR